MRSALQVLSRFRDAVLRKVLPAVRQPILVQTAQDPGGFAGAGDVNTMTWCDESTGENRHLFMVGFDAVGDRTSPIG